MLPWKTLDTAAIEGGKTLSLHQHDTTFSVRVNGTELMSSRAHASEDSLGSRGCESVRKVPRARVLVGGLGFGFTLRAALDTLASDAMCDVAELSSAVLRWNEEHLGHLASHPLRDPRVRVHCCDVQRFITDPESSGRYHAVLLDVDNGPFALSIPTNGGLYSPRGLVRIREVLCVGGRLAVWSASDDDRFTTRLREAGFSVNTEVVRSRVHEGRARGAHHVLWLADRV